MDARGGGPCHPGTDPPMPASPRATTGRSRLSENRSHAEMPDTGYDRPSAPTVPLDGADPQRSHGSAGADARTATGPLTLAAAYARVSTDRQDREQTIDSQIDALRRAAEQR